MIEKTERGGTRRTDGRTAVYQSLLSSKHISYQKVSSPVRLITDVVTVFELNVNISVVSSPRNFHTSRCRLLSCVRLSCGSSRSTRRLAVRKVLGSLSDTQVHRWTWAPELDLSKVNPDHGLQPTLHEVWESTSSITLIYVIISGWKPDETFKCWSTLIQHWCWQISTLILHQCLTSSALVVSWTWKSFLKSRSSFDCSDQHVKASPCEVDILKTLLVLGERQRTVALKKNQTCDLNGFSHQAPLEAEITQRSVASWELGDSSSKLFNS